ncbi:MAG: superfamily protein [Myxococcaceae bacterium]|nr:superfamily protein [Myxococcaceae bacterium]
MTRALRHVRALWPDAGVLLPLPFVLWPLGCVLAGLGRWEHAAFMTGVPALAFTNARSKRLFLGLLPFGVLGLVYDAMRFVKDVGVSTQRVHLCDLRAIDMRIASATVGGERGTVHDWLQTQDSLPLDLLFALPYGTFLFVAIAFAVYLYVKDYERMRVFGWVFLLVNLGGFATYHLYPAAPPWYFHAHGCAVDLSAHASEGPKLARVDAFLGIHFFHDFYGRASDVFGAVPSLHVAYPLLILLFGWPVLRTVGRSFAILFLVLMCTAAVYLDHHWIIDVVVGLAYTLAVFAVAMALVKPSAATRSPAVEAPS